MKIGNKIDQLYARAVASAEDRAGGKRAFMVIGSTFRQALVAQEILTTLAFQVECIPAEAVRSLMDELRDRLREDDSLIGV